MLALIFQGGWMRIILTRKMSLLFARNSAQQGFVQPNGLNKAQIQHCIDAKQALLEILEPTASEALFSPALRHWFRHPVLSFRYLRLAEQEADLIGARQQSGFLLQWSRRIHMLLAVLFITGLIAHIVTVLFFAGYAAGDGPITWWHITDWGR